MSKAATAGSPEELPFEQALEKLEAIVEEMESDELPLERLLQRFEEGTRLAAQCQKQLDDAELKIQKLDQTLAGEWKVTPASAPDTDDAG